MTNAGDSRVSEPYSAALFDAVMRATPDWVRGRLQHIAPGVALDEAAIILRIQTAIRNELSELLKSDVDDQRENPLHVIRRCAETVNADLETANVPYAQRDEFEIRAMPNDVYAFGPLTWRDLSEDVHDAGITWGAWKAATVLSRRRDEGKLQ